jgi:hypothetical protein
MQSVATVDEEGVVGLPGKQETSNALARIFDSINNASTLSQSERMELLLRWHSICLSTSADTISLGGTICTRFGVKQDIWPSANHADDQDLFSFPSSPTGRKSVLHAVTIQDLVEQLPRGRAHALYMPTALFSAAIIYATFVLGGVTCTKLSNTVNWRQVCTGHATQDKDTLNYLEGSTTHFPGSERNLSYDLNSTQKLFRCLATRWGIAFDIEAMINQLLSKRTQTQVRSHRV